MGKCALALVATLLFALLGTGLVRWGADRAGRMMLIATLIVVPIHFMLAGELKLLLRAAIAPPRVPGDRCPGLVGMVRWVSGMLARRAGARFLTVALLLLSSRQRGDDARLADRLGPAVCLVSIVAPGVPESRSGHWVPGGGAHRTTSTATSPT